MAEYILSAEADRDLIKIFRYSVRNFGNARAELYRETILSAIRAAAASPEIGREFRTSTGVSYYRFNAGRHAIFYESISSGIRVVRVLHLMMDFGLHLS